MYHLPVPDVFETIPFYLYPFLPLHSKSAELQHLKVSASQGFSISRFQHLKVSASQGFSIS